MVSLRARARVPDRIVCARSGRREATTVRAAERCSRGHVPGHGETEAAAAARGSGEHFDGEPTVSTQKVHTCPSQVSFFGMWPLFPIVFLLGPRSANVLDRPTFAAIHVVFDIVCKGVLSLALLRVRAFMETIGWYGYSLSSKDIREKLISRLSEDSQASRPHARSQ